MTEQSMIDSSNRFITNHWRGNYPLGQSFWLHYLLAPNLLSIPPWWFMTQAKNVDEDAMMWFTAGTVLVLSAVWIWGMVGTYRSAKRYASNNPTALTPKAAKVFIILSFVILLLAVVGTSILFGMVGQGLGGNGYR
jgi:hypothetical protein